MLVNKFVDSQNKQDIILSHRSVLGGYWTAAEEMEVDGPGSRLWGRYDEFGGPKRMASIQNRFINYKQNKYTHAYISDVTEPENMNSLHWSSTVQTSTEQEKIVQRPERQTQQNEEWPEL